MRLTKKGLVKLGKILMVPLSLVLIGYSANYFLAKGKEGKSGCPIVEKGMYGTSLTQETCLFATYSGLKSKLEQWRMKNPDEYTAIFSTLDTIDAAIKHELEHRDEAIKRGYGVEYGITFTRNESGRLIGASPFVHVKGKIKCRDARAIAFAPKNPSLEDRMVADECTGEYLGDK